MSTSTPVLPYAGTSGWSGSDASRERAATEDTNGTTAHRQAALLSLLAGAGATGLTYREVGAATGWHHGQSTGALSTLHKTGLIRRLKSEKRDRCSVYVLPEHVGARETASHGRKDGTRGCANPEHKDILAKLAKVEELVRPQWRSYSYTRNDLIDDIRRILL